MLSPAAAAAAATAAAAALVSGARRVRKGLCEIAVCLIWWPRLVQSHLNSEDQRNFGWIKETWLQINMLLIATWQGNTRMPLEC
ncbi:uncharacterized protein LOC143844499 isoform X1 [Paroedura picta]|uniref:uncharacterized protein LOC143844499 isoform X1 n=1 Tax=Paroedura picta TaxID=143630 RepID=UPI0040570D79